MARKQKIKTKQIIVSIFTSIIVVVGSLLTLSLFKIGGLQIYSVHSGSMEPEINVGSVVFSLEKDSYEVEDVIVFESKSPEKRTTHRIFRLIPAGEFDENDVKSSQDRYITKGDANEAPDIDAISKDKVLGRVVYNIPYIGYIIGFARTVPGLIILIIIPATIIIYEEIGSIKKEIAKIKRKKKKEEKKEKEKK